MKNKSWKIVIIVLALFSIVTVYAVKENREKTMLLNQLAEINRQLDLEQSWQISANSEGIEANTQGVEENSNKIHTVLVVIDGVETRLSQVEAIVYADQIRENRMNWLTNFEQQRLNGLGYNQCTPSVFRAGIADEVKWLPFTTTGDILYLLISEKRRAGFCPEIFEGNMLYIAIGAERPTSKFGGIKNGDIVANGEILSPFADLKEWEFPESICEIPPNQIWFTIPEVYSQSKDGYITGGTFYFWENPGNGYYCSVQRISIPDLDNPICGKYSWFVGGGKEPFYDNDRDRIGDETPIPTLGGFAQLDFNCD